MEGGQTLYCVEQVDENAVRRKKLGRHINGIVIGGGHNEGKGQV